MSLGGTVLLNQLRKDGRNVVLKNEILLIGALEQAAAQAIHGLALLVHHVGRKNIGEIVAGFQ